MYPIHPNRPMTEFVRRLQRRFAVAMGVLLVTIFISTAGFLVLNPRQGSMSERLLLSLWETLNIVSTLGNFDHELTMAERIWAMLVIVFGLGAVLYGFGLLQALL